MLVLVQMHYWPPVWQMYCSNSMQLCMHCIFLSCLWCYYYTTPAQRPLFQDNWVSQYLKGKTSLDLSEARDGGVWGCSGISWIICKQSAPGFRQITTPTPHHSTCSLAGWSSWCPTNSVKALKAFCRAPAVVFKNTFIRALYFTRILLNWMHSCAK